MSNNMQPLSQTKKPLHRRNDSDELDVFEAAWYFAGANENFIGTHNNDGDQSKNYSNNNIPKYYMRPIGRMSLDMPTHRGNSIPLQAMMMENPMMINKEKKFKQPSSPGGKLAHFLNTLFNQTSSKKSKSKSKKDEDVSPSGWRRKRRSSISHFRSGNNNSTTTSTTTTTTTTIVSDSKSLFSTSSGYRTPPPYHIAHTPTKTTSYREHRSYSDHKPPASEITKLPINGNLNKIENFKIKSDVSDKKMSFGNGFGFVEKAKILEHDEHHPHEYASKDKIKEFKRFIDEDDADSDSSSDLFELTNCDLGYSSSGLPVYETTRIDSIKRGAPISG